MKPSRAVSATLIVLAALPWGVAGKGGPAMKPRAELPDDRPREHQVTLSSSPREYQVVMDAEVDGVMARMPVGYAAYHQGWQPNRFLRLENIGQTVVVNPWITINEKRNWRTLADMARAAVRGCETEAEKARAVWEFTRHHRFHATTWDNETNDAIKVFNVYGYTLCGNDAQVISDLWKAVGLKIRRGYPVGHVVAEAYYDGAYHLLDGDEHCIYLLRDNRTIASEARVVDDHDLIKRTHTYGILAGDDRSRDEFSASLFGYEGERKGEWGGKTKHTMEFRLRPAESIEWRWDHIGKQYTAGTELTDGKWRKDGQGDLSVWGKDAYANLRNGRMRYTPDLDRPPSRDGLADSANLASPDGKGLHPEEPAKAAHATWRIGSPYVIVGARVRVSGVRTRAADRFRLSLSADGKKWEPVWEAGELGAFEQEVTLDEMLSPRRRPQYAYYLRVDLRAESTPAGATLKTIDLHTDVQMSALGLPELEAGSNLVRYTDETVGPRQVRLTHSWVERPAWRRPEAPTGLSPDGGTTVQGTRVRFTWDPPSHPAGAGIVDYRIQLCRREDMRWVLSPNFDKLISKTPSRGKTEWTVPFVGLLNPETTYYWRVCARDANGVWGPWSARASFRCTAPGVPLNVRAEADRKTGRIRLTWESNPHGAQPVSYRVYGSNERGFSVSDVPYRVRMGRGFCRTIEEYEAKGKVKQMVDTPANFMAALARTRLAVAGPGVDVPNANTCFYRVVAVDARGIRSGPSDCAKAPRPFLVTRPPTEVRAGDEFVYRARSLSSIGDLRSKRGYKAAFWNREELTFTLAEAPAWLGVDGKTGVVTGTPPREAAEQTHQVTLRVATGNGSIAEQTFPIRVTVPR